MGNQSSYEETFRIGDKDTSKCTKRCGEVEEAFENKAKTKGRSWPYRRHIKRLVTEIEMLKVVLYLVSRKQHQ
jgi:hypothetical protein